MRKKKLTVMEEIVKELSMDKLIPEKLINQVVMHQFNSAHDALKNNFSVEISGFGKFLFNTKKAERKLKKLNDIKRAYENQLTNVDIPEKKANYIKGKLSSANITINSISLKLNNRENVDNS